MIDQSAVLQIPYFEFLRLRAWIQMAFPKVILGIGYLTTGQGSVTVNRFKLLRTADMITQDLLLDVAWGCHIAIVAHDMPLLFIHSNTLLVKHEARPIFEQLKDAMPGILTHYVVMLMGLDGIIHALYTLRTPFELERVLHPKLIMPVADESAIVHWIDEYRQISSTNHCPTADRLQTPFYYDQQIPVDSNQLILSL